MDEKESLSHTKWECKNHVVFIPKCRRRTLYVELRRYLPKLNVLGGCCGTDHRHVGAVCAAWGGVDGSGR